MEDSQVKESEPKKLTPKSIDGRFRIVREIGRGAAGIVYEGVQLSVDRRVAVKVLHGDHQKNRDYIERFSREAKAIARLSHTNCITLFDFGFSKEFRSHYMVMEYIEGKELFAVTRDGPLPFRIALRIAIQISEAIAHAHKHGILHRDLKPENVLVTTDWEVKVLDFGLARLLDMFATDGEGRRLTAQGAVFGTPAYMSPEQCSGDIDVTVRSDIYSLGVVLYELFEGEVPFDSTEVLKILVQHAKDPPPPMTAKVPNDVKQLVMQMLAKDPKARPRTGMQVADTLRAVLINIAEDLRDPGADISQEIQRSLLRGIDRADQTGENIRTTEDGLEHKLARTAATRAATMDLVGEELGAWTIDSIEEQSSAATVFRGHGQDEQPVAIRMISGLDSRQLHMWERFQTQEFEPLKGLRDPTIAGVLDAEHDPGADRAWVVTERSDGDDLQTICDAGRTPSELAVRVAEHVARALATAHAAGVTHGKISPSRIRLVPRDDGRVVAQLDGLGLASMLPPLSPKWMAPEQLRGGSAGAPADLYGLGVVLYQMLSGHGPFTGRTDNEIAAAALEKAPRPLADYVREVPRPLSDLIARLMSKDPARRPTAEQLRQLIEQVKSGLTVRDLRVEHTGPAPDLVKAWRLRRPVAAPTADTKTVTQRSNTQSMPAVKDDDRPLDWKPSRSSAWVAFLIAILAIAVVILGFMLLGDGGLKL